jgi:hypothetical protein
MKIRVCYFMLMGLLVGCGKSDRPDYVTTSNGLVYHVNQTNGHLTVVGGMPEVYELTTVPSGLVYRINKNTGDVSLIAGAQITRLHELSAAKTDVAKKSYVRDWPVYTVKSIGDVSLRLKTTWRDGKLHYILHASPISSQVQIARDTAYSEARFNINFYDADGFELLTVPVKIKEMPQVIDDDGRPQSLSATGLMQCSVETYEAIAASGIGWSGFQKESKQKESP